MDKTEVNCLEKNPCVEKHYSEMTKEQRLAEIDDSIQSASKILQNLFRQRSQALTEWLMEVIDNNNLEAKS